MNTANPGPETPILTEGGITFRDLNKNGRLDPYEDPRLPIEEKIADLLSQMTLEEKAGTMFHTMIGMNKDGSLVEESNPFSPVPTTESGAKEAGIWGRDPRTDTSRALGEKIVNRIADNIGRKAEELLAGLRK